MKEIEGTKESREEDLPQQSIGVPEERVHVVLGDVTGDEVRKRIVESTVARWGHLDILVNNAAASITNGKRGFEADDDAYVKTMDVNLRSVIELVRIARPHLIRSKGEIVNVSSIAALNFGVSEHSGFTWAYGNHFKVVQIKHDPYYSISKAGLDQLTRALAIDLIEYEVRVNGVYKFYGSQRNAVPRGSNGNPQEIANVIAFLADRKMSSYIVGQMIVADGGTSLIMGAYTYDFDKVLLTANQCDVRNHFDPMGDPNQSWRQRYIDPVGGPENQNLAVNREEQVENCELRFLYLRQCLRTLHKVVPILIATGKLFTHRWEAVLDLEHYYFDK
ncbi:hypothetical protein TELCIR_09305 [Teladorsagia circumcincta]|uniref:Oxidoreductase, short chain dehydrogenase/reductase family protein n=1 Tax=Teladorsagia circumcincta TaxID=45464 RepID=A0A2G9UFF3_TELCI|nr:hypothetical protein TELCIR_09305 [Teladorsagia circumcincta]